MKEILDDLDRWRAAGKRVALARVVDIEGSGPRDPGAAMAVNEDGEVAGSVSGGCVEGAVVTEALDVLAHRRAAAGHLRLQRRRGLRRRPDLRRHHPPVHRTAGLVMRVRRDLRRARGGAAGRPAGGARRPSSRARTWGPSCSSVPTRRSRVGSLGDPDLDRVVGRDALGELEAGTTIVRHYGEHGEAREHAVSVFIESFAPPPRMLDLRRGRLHQGAGQGGQGARLPGHRVRRPRGVRHPAPLPRRRRGGRRLAPPAARARRVDASAPATRSAC